MRRLAASGHDPWVRGQVGCVRRSHPAVCHCLRRAQ
ncbi:hypothetical protein CupriaWKF_17765 [Cupriavidus sp. WKF15]|nr:hypothetical protein [Cupriavidus sp. WKF15]WER50185.1 hypothetical protein CupriaWKF_17765 [Cupriavidus sp. WKF15]